MIMNFALTISLLVVSQCCDKTCSGNVCRKVNASVTTQPTTTQSAKKLAEKSSMRSLASQPRISDVSSETIKTSQPTYDKKIITILDKLEKAGTNIKTLQANVKHELYQMIPDDRQTKLGFIRYIASIGNKNARFMIFFDTLIHDNLKLHRKEYFCFDGHWLREIRQQTKTVIDREIVAPNEKINPFKLGEGPFPLPFGQKRQEILENFQVKLVPSAKQDSENTQHLILIPKPKSKFNKKYKKIEFRIDNKLNLPVKIVALDRHSNQITVYFSNIKINTKLKDNQLWVPIPEGYAYQKESLAE